MKTVLHRDDFRNSVFKRDNHKCIVCGCPNEISAHHILERALFIDGGYYIDNGATLCPEHHLEAEKTTLSCKEIRKLANISNIIVPTGCDPNNNYDKWGNVIVLHGIAVKGPMFETEQCKKILSNAALPHVFVDWENYHELLKYPRTRHLLGSGLSKGDLDDYVSFEELKDKNLVIESKIDGANTALSFHGCDLKLQCRGHFLGNGNDYAEFNEFKTWGQSREGELFDILEDRYIMYGEWMQYFHSVFYDNLPDYFMEFDIYDKKRMAFLDTPSRKELLRSSVYNESEAAINISQVRVITEHVFNSIEEIISCMGQSAFITKDAYRTLGNQLDHKQIPEKELLLSLNENRTMEGLYIKWEEDGIVKGRYKYVRPGFVQTLITSGTHWKNRPKITNYVRYGH